MLTRLVAGESIGTRFSPLTTTMESRKRYILAGGNNIHGTLSVDAGAEKALRKGGSLLPVGVTDVKGKFDRGDTVRVVNCRRQRGRPRPGELHRRRAWPHCLGNTPRRSKPSLGQIMTMKSSTATTWSCCSKVS